MPALPDFPEDLDPADAEFENGLLAFYNGAYFPGPDSRRTVQFATAIRSAVTARQINMWMREHPDDYAKWKAGRKFGGATFLGDEAAADEAERAWKFVDYLLNRQQPLAIPFEKQLPFLNRIAKLYDSWEDSVL